MDERLSFLQSEIRNLKQQLADRSKRHDVHLNDINRRLNESENVIRAAAHNQTSARVAAEEAVRSLERGRHDLEVSLWRDQVALLRELRLLRQEEQLVVDLWKTLNE